MRTSQPALLDGARRREVSTSPSVTVMAWSHGVLWLNSSWGYLLKRNSNVKVALPSWFASTGKCLVRSRIHQTRHFACLAVLDNGSRADY